MAKILIGNVKPVKGVDYFTQEDIDEMGEIFAKKEDVGDLSVIEQDVVNLTAAVEDTNEAIAALDGKFAPAYTYGTDDLEAGTTPLETGKIHFVYN